MFGKIFNSELSISLWRLLSLKLKLVFLKALLSLKSTIQRNSLIIKATTLTFFIIMFLSIILTLLVFSYAPELSENIRSFIHLSSNYEDIPSPFTEEFFSYVFLNNSSHFWNPIRMVVWLPFFGSLLLGFEILLNGGLIGAIGVIAGITNNITYPIIGMVPHGIIEIPAFLLQVSSIVLWQVTITEAIVTKFKGKPLEKAKIKKNYGMYSLLQLLLSFFCWLLLP